jgi:hypothetical protein
VLEFMNITAKFTVLSKKTSVVFSKRTVCEKRWNRLFVYFTHACVRARAHTHTHTQILHMKFSVIFQMFHNETNYIKRGSFNHTDVNSVLE